MGAGPATACIFVSDTKDYRHAEYFWKDLSVNNASAAVRQAVRNQAVLTNATNTVIGNLFLPKTPEAFAYDRDGNLTNDGRWMLTWDAENRLVKMESYSSAPTASKRRINYTYDSQSRLLRRALEDGSSGSYVVTNDQKLLWNDWLCLADLNATNNVVDRSYLWGLDLSGSLQGAGGIGGLLAIADRTSGLTSFLGYDGNGNVTALASGTDGSVSARYEYDPFGWTLRATGPMASANPIRFSTKRAEDAADLTYYGYRFYTANLGRWLSRDPIGERGGPNSYSFVRNAPSLLLDLLGLEFVDGGKTGSDIVWFAGGTGGQGNQDTGSIQLRVDPVYDGVDKGCRCWVTDGTGLVRVERSFKGVVEGWQGPLRSRTEDRDAGVVVTVFTGDRYFSSTAVDTVDAHERGHVIESQRIYNETIKSAEDAANTYRGPSKALQFGKNRSECIAELRRIIDWSTSLAAFLLMDTAVNRAGGIYDTSPGTPLLTNDGFVGWYGGVGIEYEALNFYE